MRRLLAAFLLALAAVMAHSERILLVPLDSRPAAGQFAQMIGNMAAVDVVTPPLDMLGRFTQPGMPDQVLDWLEAQDYRDVSAVIVSADLIAYGGLIASRSNETPSDIAIHRLQRLAELRKREPS